MEDDYRRLAALRAYEVLDTPPDPVLDRIADLTACVFQAPLACVSLVDSQRLFLKAAHGVDARELGNEPGMCVTTVETNAPRQVTDLLLDDKASEHPLVTEAPNLRFYAGTPLRSRDGYAIGTLCVLDQEVRELTAEQMECLDILALLVMERLEHHRREAERAAQARLLDHYGPFVRLGANLSPVGVLELDPNGIVTRLSGSGRSLTGLEVGDHLAVMAAADPSDRRRLEDLLDRRGPQSSNGDTFGLRFTTPRGATVLLQAEADKNAGGTITGYTATIRELSDVAELGEQVLEAQKLESLGALAGGIAHDFNNVLAAIMGNSSLAMTAAGGDPGVQRHLENIDRATLRASNLCDQLLAYSGGGQFTVSAFDMAKLVSDMRELLEVSLSKKTTIEIRDSTRPALLEGNPTQIRQVVMNVLMNASEAIGDRPGSIVIGTSTKTLTSDQLATMFFGEGLEPGAYVCLEVVDDGEGMAPDVGARIFDPLFSTKRAGHGLGMAAVGGIMRVHRGAIEIDSSVGEGTTMRIFLPAGEGVVEAPETDAEPTAAPGLRRGTVLVVDDEPDLREILSETLMAAGYRTVCAGDGSEAMAIIDSRRHDLTAAVVDMMLPNVDGAELHTHLMAAQPDVHVVLTSGYNEREATRRITDAGAARFVKKPYRPAELVAVLDEMVVAPKPHGRLRRLVTSLVR